MLIPTFDHEYGPTILSWFECLIAHELEFRCSDSTKQIVQRKVILEVTSAKACDLSKGKGRILGTSAIEVGNRVYDAVKLVESAILILFVLFSIVSY